MTGDRIEIRGLRVHAHHGVSAEEQRAGQTFVVDVAVERELSLPSRSDDLADTLDYGALAERIAGAVAATRFDLLEALAAHIADLVLAEAEVTAVQVRVAKPQAPIPLELDEVAVVVHRPAAQD